MTSRAGGRSTISALRAAALASCAALGGCLLVTPLDEVNRDGGGDQESSTAECNDGEDNDADGFTDCADASCADSGSCGVVSGSETGAQCTDLADNDGDLAVDCDDPDCCDFGDCVMVGSSCATGSGETGDLCGNTLDDDGDRLVDCDDDECYLEASCSGTAACSVPGTGYYVGTFDDYAEWTPADWPWSGQWTFFADGAGELVPATGDPLVFEAPGANGSALGLRFTGWNLDGSGWMGARLVLDASLGYPTPVDLSFTTGIHFAAQGPSALWVDVVTLASVPVEEGGFCTLDCGNHYGFLVYPGEGYSCLSFAWSEMWPFEPTLASDIDLSQVLAIEFRPFPPGNDYDFWLDEVVLSGETALPRP